MEQNGMERIRSGRLIAIVRGIPSRQMRPLAQALLSGGIDCMEVTFDQRKGPEDTCAAINDLCQSFGDRLFVGAGTVMTLEQVRLAAQAGARYIISPNTDEAVITQTKELGLLSLPGAMTCSEIARADQAGADMVKVFPAAALGVNYWKAITAPLKHIPMMAVGGISTENIADFDRAGAIAFGIGGKLVDARLLAQGRFDEVERMARQYVTLIRRRGA